MAIEQVLYRYAHFVDRGSIDDAVALFASEAELEVVDGTEISDYKGQGGVRTWLQTYHFDRAGRIRDMRHKVTTPLIEVDGDTATAVSYLDADGVDTASGRAKVTVGRYEDRLSRRDGRWIIVKRRLILHDRRWFADD